jgi:hypothetical protein
MISRSADLRSYAEYAVAMKKIQRCSIIAGSGLGRTTWLDRVQGNHYLALSSRAEVAELADAHDSGSCVRKDVEVRVLSSAPSPQ